MGSCTLHRFLVEIVRIEDPVTDGRYYNALIM